MVFYSQLKRVSKAFLRFIMADPFGCPDPVNHEVSRAVCAIIQNMPIPPMRLQSVDIGFVVQIVGRDRAMGSNYVQSSR